MPETNPLENNIPLQEANQRRIAAIEQRENSYARTAHAVIDAALAVPAAKRPQVTKTVKDSLWKAWNYKDRGDTFKARQDFMEELIVRTLARFTQEGKKTKAEIIPNLQAVDKEVYENAPKISEEILYGEEQEKKQRKEGEVWQKYYEAIGKIAGLISQIDLREKNSISLAFQPIHEMIRFPTLDWRKTHERAAMVDEDVFLELLNLLEAEVGSKQAQEGFSAEHAQTIQTRITDFVKEIKKLQVEIEAAIKVMDRAKNPFFR